MEPIVETASAGGKRKKLLDQMRDAMRLQHRLWPFLVAGQSSVTATIRRYGSDAEGSVSSLIAVMTLFGRLRRKTPPLPSE